MGRIYSQLRRTRKGLPALLLACQTGSATVPAAYARDVQRLCDAVSQSGAGSAQGGDRTVLIAMWLGKNLETQELRDFLVKMQAMTPAQKRAALEAEATRAGLAHCAL